MKSRLKTVLPLGLALTVVLSGSALYVQAENDKSEGRKNKIRAEQKIKQKANDRGNARQSARKDAIQDMKSDFKDARDENRVERKEQRKDAIEDKKEAFNKARHDFREAVRQRRDGADNGRKLSDEFFDTRFIVDEDLTRRVLVRGEVADENDFVLIRVTAPDEDRLSRIFLENRNGEPDTIWLERLFHPTFKVGSVIRDNELSEITFLPLDYNARFGLPVHEDFRLGVVNDQIILVDMDRQLVLDALHFDSEGQLISRELNIDNPRLLAFRLADAEEAILRAYLLNHPELVPAELTLGERFRQNILLPLGISQVRIGERLPLLADPLYLPDAVHVQAGLPGTELELALVGNDLVLIDPDTRLVLDVVDDVV